MAYRSNRVLAGYSVECSASVLRHRSQGSALLLVLFAIILLTGLITATVGFVKNDVDEYGALNKEFRARQLAESGMAFGIHPQVQSEDRSLLEQQTPDGGRFRVTISSESTKLNVNALLQAGRDDLFENLFGRWGVAPKDAEAAVKGLRNYLSSPHRDQPALQPTNAVQAAPQNTNVSQLGPQPGSQNTNQLGQQFAAIEEMSLVPEFGPVIEKQPDWANFFTIWGDGKIDVNLADADTIDLIRGVSPATADEFVKYRWGPDGKPFTLDDRLYNSMDEVRAALGMSPEQFQLVESLITLTSEVDRIESTGIIAGYEKTIAVVATRNTSPVRYLSWQEK